MGVGGRRHVRCYFGLGDHVEPPHVRRVVRHRFVVDGEIVALDGRGRPSFSLLQHRMHLTKAPEIEREARRIPVQYLLFDVLELDGRDAAPLPLERSPGYWTTVGRRLLRNRLAMLAALILLAMEAAKSTDPRVYKDKVMDVANAPGEQIMPGQLDRALELIAAGTDIDYVGASSIEMVGAGESAGVYREVSFDNGEMTVVGYR